MTEDTNTKPASSKNRSHVAYDVQDREDADSIWTPIGSMWAHRDAKGFNLVFDDGRRIVLRTPAKKKAA